MLRLSKHDSTLFSSLIGVASFECMVPEIDHERVAQPAMTTYNTGSFDKAKQPVKYSLTT
jgi:hypothetical protein